MVWPLVTLNIQETVTFPKFGHAGWTDWYGGRLAVTSHQETHRWYVAGTSRGTLRARQSTNTCKNPIVYVLKNVSFIKPKSTYAIYMYIVKMLHMSCLISPFFVRYLESIKALVYKKHRLWVASEAELAVWVWTGHSSHETASLMM